MANGFLSAIGAAMARFWFRAASGKERLWKVWWLAGIPVAGLTTELVILAEDLRSAGSDGWGDALDVARLLVYFAWFRLAWRCSGNVDHILWARLAQGGLISGLILSVML